MRLLRPLLLASLLATATNLSAQASPKPKVLAPLPGDDGGIAFAINNKGVAAGVSNGVGADGAVVAVKWNRKGEPTALPPLAGDTQSAAFAINLRGEVAGDSGDEVGRYYFGIAVRWDTSGRPQALRPLPGDTVSHAEGINNAGEVAGLSEGPDGRTAVIWDRDGAPGALQGGYQGRAINNRGMAAGVDKLGNPVVWSRDGVPRNLTLPGPACDDWPSVIGITWRGEVLGHAKFEDAYCAPVIWNQAGEPEFLDFPASDDPIIGDPYLVSFATGIESTGEVAGAAIDGRALLWDRSGSPISLSFPEGYDGGSGQAINNRGAVAGFVLGPGVVSGEHTYVPVVWR